MAINTYNAIILDSSFIENTHFLICSTFPSEGILVHNCIREHYCTIDFPIELVDRFKYMNVKTYGQGILKNNHIYTQVTKFDGHLTNLRVRTQAENN